ncbi:YjbH domain-containing protein [Pseudoalteromonas fenneropenaei]|uniref:YjbH domain-containing protein n=1 Tax=Pseudoalteromonas fenneropenaei TaxID=1737459 RepID=A0ABV7CKF5_9GAMM
MKQSRQAQLLLASLCAGATFTTSANNQTDQAFYGFTGLFNIPNAEVLDRGDVAVGYNNQLEFRGKYVDGYNFNFAAGLFEGLEVAGKIASSSMNHNLFSSQYRGKETRDLSFNLKYQVPYIPKDWFTLAIGGQDLGGAANNYEAYYAVASKELGDFRFTLGAGSTENLTGRLDGAFGGVEWMPFTWLTVSAEHDAQALNAGVKVHIPSEWTGDWVDLTLSGKLYSDVDDTHTEDSSYFGINAKFKLLKEEHKVKVSAAPDIQQIATKHAPALRKQTYTKAELNEYQTSINALEKDVIALKYQLLKDGFEGVEVGYNDSEVAVIFENHVFNRNELDALGLVLGRIQAQLPAHIAFTVTMKKLDISQVQIKGLVADYQNFITQGITPALTITQTPVIDRGGLKWVHHGANKTPYWLPRVALSPALVTTVATELGVLDYSLALQADVSLPLWQGASIDVSARQHLTSSDDYKDGQPFNFYEHKNGVKDILFTQTLKLPFNITNQTQAGLYQDFYDMYGVRNQSLWHSPAGAHQLTAEVGYFEYKDYSSELKYYVGGYRYHFADHDVTLSAKAGKFLYGDTGFKLEGKFWFGDAAVDIFYQNTDVQMVGIGFNIPLTPRKDYAVTQFGQLSGNKNWRHQVRTRIGETSNNLSFNTAILPQTSQSIERTYLNQDRLSVGYIQNHLERLKEAYSTFK